MLLIAIFGFLFCLKAIGDANAIEKVIQSDKTPYQIDVKQNNSGKNVHDSLISYKNP